MSEAWGVGGNPFTHLANQLVVVGRKRKNATIDDSI